MIIRILIVLAIIVAWIRFVVWELSPRLAPVGHDAPWPDAGPEPDAAHGHFGRPDADAAL